ncbi:MAG: CerR family C-terminal domain-containing protein, partial [Deltaproteobacteria bacterium]
PGQDDQEVKLRVFAIMGQILMFHVSPSAIKRTLNWENYEPDNLDAIRCVILDNLKGIFAMPGNSSNASAQTGNVY